MRKIRKKGMQQTTLNLIIGLVIFILAMLISSAVNAAINKSKQREICRISISKIELIREATSGGVGLTLECPMSVIDVQDKDLPDRTELKARNIKREFAEAMFGAWYVAGKGTHNSFQRKMIPGAEVYCLLYSRINMINVSGVDETDLGDMSTWMDSIQVPESDQTFFEYLTFEGQKAWHILDASDPSSIKEVDSIDPNRNYYVVYWASMEGEGVVGLLDDTLDGLAAIVSALEANDEDDELVPQIFIVPEDQFAFIKCQHIMN